MAQTQHFADRWFEAVAEKGAPVCVGIDPVLERLPLALGDDPIEAIDAYCRGVLDAVALHVPAVKPQLACFERYGSAGYVIYERLVRQAHAYGLLVIADAKRGDIGTSSAHYAAGLLGDADALTINAYLGADGMQPFVDEAAAQGAGLFALVRTSNPGGDALQRLELTDGRTVADAVADIVAETGAAYTGDSGYSLLGAVVGATQPADAVALRKRMPNQLFLVPGYGAQGGTAEDVRACFNPDGRGAIVTASRSVIYAYKDRDDPDWADAVAAAAAQLNHDIAEVLR